MPIPRCEAKPVPAHSPQPLSNCPDCRGNLVLFRIVSGAAADYRTMRCVNCGGIHLDIRASAQE